MEPQKEGWGTDFKMLKIIEDTCLVRLSWNVQMTQSKAFLTTFVEIRGRRKRVKHLSPWCKLKKVKILKSYKIPWFERTLWNLLIIVNETNKALQGLKYLRSVTHPLLLYLDYFQSQLWLNETEKTEA